MIEGRGGKSGLQYEVKVSSLPAHLQDRLNALQTSFDDPSKSRLGEGAQLKRTWIYDVIRPALAYPKGSNERGREIASLDGTKRLNWNGKHQLLSKSVLYRWIEQYERGGIHALGGKVRSDKGVRRVFISRAWTNAVPFDDRIKATIHDDLKAYVRGLIKGDGQFKQTRVLASEKLIAITGAHGFRVNDPQREAKVFHIPAAFIRDEVQFKAVARHRKDRKAVRRQIKWGIRAA